MASKELTRGQRRRAKKIKKKYADQDDEDRILGMEAVGNPLIAEEEEEKTSEKTLVEKTSAPRTKKKEDDEVKKIMEEENIVELPEDEKVDFLDAFTGLPLPDDILVSGMVVCAPYSALSNYKYKVKLTPGTQKKGKACKQAMHLFVQSDSCTPAEKSVMKFITDNELVNACLPSVKVSAPGLYAAKNAQRKNKRNSKKSKK